MPSVRQLTAYEKNQLQKNGFDASSSEILKKIGEMPVEYFLEKVEFDGREFKVTKDVLIPRVETEQLIKIIKKDINGNRGQCISLVEVGTGCGAIGLSLAHYLENKSLAYYLIATDICPKALKIAKHNYCALFPNETSAGDVDFFEGNLLRSLPKVSHLDYIIANLPYVPSKRISKLDSSVKDFEPTLALDGGKDGLDLIKKLLNQAIPLLKPKGKVFLEVDDTHTADFFEPYQDKWKIKHIKDQFDKNRFVELKLVLDLPK